MLEIQFILISIIVFIVTSLNTRLSNTTREFVINKYLKLRLENRRTNIYVNNKRFQQCMYLLLNVDLSRVEDYDEIESIDEAAEKLNRSMERNHRGRNRITPEEEFMGHCSNIQAWADNGYDTRILHRNLAFPLLKRLAEVGDPNARRVFKEEIAMRYASGYPTVVNFLTQNGYLKHLDAEEFESILEDKKLPILDAITTDLKSNLEGFQSIDFEHHVAYSFNNILRNFGIQHVPLIISHIIKDMPVNKKEKLVKSVYNAFKSNLKFPLIQFLNSNLEYFKDFDYDFVKYKGQLVGIFQDNKLLLTHQNIQDISIIDLEENNYESVEELDLSDNQIVEIKGLEVFSNLKVLRLNDNQLTQIEGLEHLKKLQYLSLRNNRISEIKGLESLSDLHTLDLSGNTNISVIPESVNKLTSLETLKLWNCKIKNYIESTSKYFWMNQNYRSYSGYTENDKEFYEKTHNNKASSNNKLYKHFVEWVIKIRNLMKKQRFDYSDIEKFEKETTRNAIWSGKTTSTFKKWLKDKNQKRITSYF